MEYVIIKIGGNATEQLSDKFFGNLREWQAAGKQIIIIHGGGPQISAWSTKMGLPVEKHHGIRVTSAETLAVTQAVLLGVVQPQLCQTLTQHGFEVLGINTAENQLLQGDYVDQANLGQVGYVTHVNQQWLSDNLHGQIAVLAPLVQTTNGQMLNANADVAAAKIASELNAQQLMLLTDVPGVMQDGDVISELDHATAHDLIAHEVIKAGMQPKIKAAFEALEHGVGKVLITDDVANEGTQLKYA